MSDKRPLRVSIPASAGREIAEPFRLELGGRRPVRSPLCCPSRSEGASLAIVLIVSVVIASLAGVSAYLAVSGSHASEEWSRLARDAVACESAADLLRAEVVNDYQSSGLSLALWLGQIRAGERFGPGVTKTYASFPGVRAWVKGVSPHGSGSLWLDIVASTIEGVASSSQSVEQRIRFGSNRVMDFAMLSETTDCMYCHLQVNGDVGSLGQFYPGWGEPFSGSTSTIQGDVYLAGEAVNAAGDSINGTTFTGEVHENYTGPKFGNDTDEDGVPDFPTVDPDVASASAQGRIWAGDSSNSAGDGSGVWVTPLLGTWDRLNAASLDAPPSGPTGTTWKPSSSSVLPSVIDGNLTLVGTADNPIRIEGDVFVRGDVVISGHVEGKGAIYAGRNTYIAGDIVYTDPPEAMADDADAIQAISEDRDELRIAARGNVVIGDWTYRATDGSVLPMRERQGQSFADMTLGLDSVRHYRPTAGTDSSTEVTYSDGVYRDDRGQVVPPEEVITVDNADALGYEGADVIPARYDPVMAPGQMTPEGFQSWMSQDDYREIVGRAQYEDMMYRLPAPSDPSLYNTELGPGWDAKVASLGTDGAYYDAAEGRYVRRLGGTVYGIETGAKEYTKHVTHIDAFLYSNKRIVGLTPMVSGLTVNGGMVSGEIQVIAPGRGNEAWWYLQPTHGESGSMPALSWQTPGGLNEYGDEQSGFFLNYDYRLRNGGFGYNLIPTGGGDRVLLVRQPAVQPPAAAQPD